LEQRALESCRKQKQPSIETQYAHTFNFPYSDISTSFSR
jgi:hypothetical protein